MRCEGYRRNGGMMTFGPVKWEQCKNDATVIITVVQDGEKQTLPGCGECWQEAIDNKITILSVEPLKAEGK